MSDQTTPLKLNYKRHSNDVIDLLTILRMRAKFIHMRNGYSTTIVSYAKLVPRLYSHQRKYFNCRIAYIFSPASRGPPTQLASLWEFAHIYQDQGRIVRSQRLIRKGTEDSNYSFLLQEESINLNIATLG